MHWHVADLSILCIKKSQFHEIENMQFNWPNIGFNIFRYWKLFVFRKHCSTKNKKTKLDGRKAYDMNTKKYKSFVETSSFQLHNISLEHFFRPKQRQSL